MAKQVELGVLDFGGWQRPVVKSPVVVGRAGDIEVVDGWVSSRHVELRREGDGFVAVDLGSSNGTSVDGVKLEPKVPASVKWGAEVRLGDRIGFRVVRPAQVDEDAPKTVEVPFPSFEQGDRPIASEKASQEATEALRKRRGRRPGFTLSERDLDVLEWIAVQRWSTQAILLEAFFAKPDPGKVKAGRKPSGKYGRERLWALEREGFIQPSRYRVGSTVPLLVSPRGYNLLHGQGRVEWAQPFPDIDASRFEHELLIQSLRLKLEQLGVQSWRSERHLAWVNRVEHLAFVPDAQFNAGGWTWNLEVERTLKSKERRKKGVEIRAKYEHRYLYVVPESIWSAVKESIKSELLGFYGGVYWLSEANARQGRMTVRCRWSEPEWSEHSLRELLSGEFEPGLKAKRLRQAEYEAMKAIRQEFYNLAFDVHNHTNAARATLSTYGSALSNRRKGVMGIGAEKITPPKFSSWGELEKRFNALTQMRRQWRVASGVELDGVKHLEQAFGAYVGQLKATEEAIAKSIADGDPQNYHLPKAKELEEALTVLRER